MANRRCYTYPRTSFILPSVLRNFPPEHIEPKYASILSILLANGFIQDTTTKSYSVLITTITGNQSPITTTNVYSLYEEYILSIIQYVIDGIAIDTILAKLQPMQQEIRTLAQAEATILVIEDVMLSIVDNLISRTNIDLILNRITYLKGLVASATNLPAAYGELAELIGYILTSITNREPIESVLTNLMTIQAAFASEGKLAEVIIQIQSTIISIVQNIIDRVDIQFVLNRFTYVRSLLAEAAQY
jgi:hypothetical protein